MVWCSIQNPRLTGAADAFVAATQDWDSFFLKDFQDRLIWRYLKSDTGTVAHHLDPVEGISRLLRCRRLGGESLDVKHSRWPVSALLLHRPEERFGSTAVHQRVVFRFREE